MRPVALTLFFSVAAAAAQTPAAIPAVKLAEGEYAAALAKAKADHDAVVKKSRAEYDAAVKAATADHDAVVKKSRAEYDAAVKAATADHRERLNAIQVDRTKANDLDGALAVRGLLKALDEAEPPTPLKGPDVLAREQFAAAVSKVVWEPGRGGWGQKFQFGPEGFLVHAGKKSRVPWGVVAPGTVVVVSGTGVVDVFTVDLAKGRVQVRTVGNTSAAAASWEASRAK